MKARRTGGKPVTCQNLKWICLYCRRPTNSHWFIQGETRWSCSDCFLKNIL